MKLRLTAVALLLAGTPTIAHRLDQYLQGAIISVEKNRVDAQMTLTPGVAVFPALLADIDSDGNGVISANERQAYAGRVMRDLSLKIDGRPLTPHLLSMQFPTIDEMKEGRGEIQIEFDADLPAGGSNRKLILENHHQSQIAAYQVNCLVSRDPGLRIVAQKRNYSQSFYELDFEQAGLRGGLLNFSWLSGAQRLIEGIALLGAAWLALLWMRRVASAASMRNYRNTLGGRQAR